MVPARSCRQTWTRAAVAGVLVLASSTHSLARDLDSGFAQRLPQNATGLRGLARLLDQLDAASSTQGELRAAITLLRSTNTSANLRQNLQSLNPALGRDEARRYAGSRRSLGGRIR